MEWTRGHTIGHGSTSTVSLATFVPTGEVFAVKSAELSNSKLLQMEQRILSSISSPYIVSYRGCDITTEHGKVMYNIFLDYEPGGTLHDAIRANGGWLHESDIAYYTWQILQGIDYLHSGGIVHCDIKGSNVLVGQHGAKITDFGCAKRVDPDGERPVQIGGTPMFMAPEVAHGEEQGRASDVWALGCTIIEMCNGGGAPWPILNNPISVIYHVGYSGQVPEFPACLSEDAKDFLDKCLRIDPKERWTTSQLLSHPFLLQSQILQNQNVVTSTTNTKRIQEPNNYSPTSILDQGIWNSMDDQGQPSQAIERVRSLALLHGGPTWDLNDDQSWITIRKIIISSDIVVREDVEVKIGFL